MGALPDVETPSPKSGGSGSGKLHANLGAAKPVYDAPQAPVGGRGGAGLPPGAPPPPSDFGGDSKERVTRAPPELPDDESSALALGGVAQARDPGEATFAF